MKTIYAAAVLLLATPAFADQVTFTCELTGGGSHGQDGFDIYASNAGPGDKTCTAACTVTRQEGGPKTWTYRNVLVREAKQRFWFGGEAGVQGAPLSDPKLETSQTSCN